MSQPDWSERNPKWAAALLALLFFLFFGPIVVMLWRLALGPTGAAK